MFNLKKRKPAAFGSGKIGSGGSYRKRGNGGIGIVGEKIKCFCFFYQKKTIFARKYLIGFLVKHS